MFFEKFPSLYYTLDNGKSVQTVTDILRRVVLSTEIRKNEAFYDQYDIKDGETPEIVANYFCLCIFYRPLYLQFLCDLIYNLSA